MDIYGRSSEFGGALSADATRVTFDDFTVGFLVQNLALGYAQQVTRIFELSSDRQYYVIGRATGNLSLARVVGPVSATQLFQAKFGDGCNADRNTVNLSAVSGCGSNSGVFARGGVSYTASNVLITNMGLNIAAGDMLINERFDMMFVGLFPTAGSALQPAPIVS